MPRYFDNCLLLVGLFWSFNTMAVVSLTEWGAAVAMSSADCSILNCSKTDFLLFNSPVVDASVEGHNQSSAQILDHENLDERGFTSASAEINGTGLSIPVLKAKASSTDGSGWVGATALGIQGYQFTGNDNTTVILDATLTGTVNNSRGSDVTGLSVGVWLMRDDPAFSFPERATSFNDFFLQTLVLPVEDSFSWDALETGDVNRSTLTTDMGDQLQIDLNNGDEFYLLAGLVAGADGVGAFADAFSTLTMEFNSTDLLPASVPIPAAFWLFCSGLLALLGFARQKAG